MQKKLNNRRQLTRNNCSHDYNFTQFWYLPSHPPDNHHCTDTVYRTVLNRPRRVPRQFQPLPMTCRQTTFPAWWQPVLHTRQIQPVTHQTVSASLISPVVCVMGHAIHNVSCDVFYCILCYTAHGLDPISVSILANLTLALLARQKLLADNSARTSNLAHLSRDIQCTELQTKCTSEDVTLLLNVPVWNVDVH